MMPDESLLSFELTPGAVDLAPEQCFLRVKVQSQYGDLTCSVLPVSSVSIEHSCEPSLQLPLLCLVAWRSATWNAFRLFDIRPHYADTSHIAALLRLSLDTPRGVVQCVEPAGWSRIDVLRPGHWAHPDKGFRMTIERNDMFVASRLDVIWSENNELFDEKHFALSLHTSSLATWLVQIFDSHDKSLQHTCQDVASKSQGANRTEGA